MQGLRSLNTIKKKFDPSLSDMLWAWKNLFKTFSTKQNNLWLGPNIKPHNSPIFSPQAFHRLQPNIFKIPLKKDKSVPNEWKRLWSRNCWKGVFFSWEENQSQDEKHTEDAKKDNHLSFCFFGREAFNIFAWSSCRRKHFYRLVLLQSPTLTST